MPITGITTGKDLAVTFSDNIQGLILTTNVKQVTLKQNLTKEKSQGLDGVIKHLAIPGGWEATIDFERTSNTLEQYFINFENLYYNGQSTPILTLAFTIQEANGGSSSYQLIGCAPSYDDAGTYKGDGYVTQKVTFMISKVKVLS